LKFTRKRLAPNTPSNCRKAPAAHWPVESFVSLC
jgi:hypothetical protein